MKLPMYVLSGGSLCPDGCLIPPTICLAPMRMTSKAARIGELAQPIVIHTSSSCHEMVADANTSAGH